MESTIFTPRVVDQLSIDLANRDARKAQASRALSLAERVRLSLEKGDKLLAEARLAHRLQERK
jgi:MoxR-like ATPase